MKDDIRILAPMAAKATPTGQAGLLILHAVDLVGGQADAPDDQCIWDGPIERRPQITWADIKRLREAVAGELRSAVLARMTGS